MENRLILTDCDGVLLNWTYAFDVWLQQHGHVRLRTDTYCLQETYGITAAQKKEYVKTFNESAAMGFLPPLRDAMFYVHELHTKHGFVFDVITSMSRNPYAVKLREMNLQKLFGTAINKLVCLDTGEDKTEALSEYKDSRLLWVEDKYENAVLGNELGLSSVIMEHDYNMKEDMSDLFVAKTWQEIHDSVI